MTSPIQTSAMQENAGKQTTDCTPAIHVQNLLFSYPKTNGQQRQFYVHNWRVATGEHVFLKGSSGSGKSTLLSLISGIVTPQQGSIHLLDTEFSALKNHQRDSFRAHNIGIIFQEFNLVPYLSVLENIELVQYFAKNKTTDTKPTNIIADICHSLQLDQQILSQKASNLSVGQRQRVAIARALVNKPKILIADEPTSALDSDNRDQFMKLLLDVCNKNGCSLVFVSHDSSLEQYFDSVQNITDIMQTNLI